MAEYDTGLGWAAKDTWLKYISPSILGEIGGSFTDPLPESPVWDYSAAEMLFSVIRTGYTDSFDMYFMANAAATIAGVQQANGTVWVYGFGLNNSTTVFCHRYYRGSDDGDYSAVTTLDLGTYYGYSGLYRTNAALYSSQTNETVLSTDFPIYNSESEMMAAVYAQLSSSTVTKDITGYAVACVAKWKTGSATIKTPVLISTVSEYTDMTVTPNPGLNLAKLEVLRNGMRFYMSFFDNTRSEVTTNNPVWDYTGPDDPTQTLEQVFAHIAMLENAAILVLDSPDPYGEEGGGSGEEGGGGDEDPEDEPVEEETLPIPAVTGLGFSTIYVPSASDLQALASYLWGGNLDLDNFLRLFANPMDSILGLSAVPLALSGTYEPIYLGGQILQGVTMPRYTGRTAVKVDMGSVTISERWGSYLDYDPYTEFAVYLPFIGIKNIKADDIMGKTVSLMYNIDILSGACVAYLRTSGGSVLYEWAGQCAMQIPITGSNWDNIFSTAITAAVTLGGAMVAPASAPMLAGSVASAAVQAVAAKPRVERSGAVTGVTGFLGQLRPYIIRTIPEAYIPNDQNKFIGYPAYITVNLANISGYNEVDSIHLEHVTATGAELEEIESILKGGVIF